jgi:hypothetical protein
MKMIDKIFVIAAVFVILTLHCFPSMGAQQDSNNKIVASAADDSLKAQLLHLEKSVNQDSYTRIPNKDFENIIDNKIQKSMREIVNWWLVVIAALISLMGFLANKYAKAYLQTIVEGKVNLLKKENEEKIKSISTHYFSTVIDSLLDFKIETITKKNNKVEESVVDDLKDYLVDESITIKEPKKVFLIDTIMRCYYYGNYPQRIEKMIHLIKQYEEEFPLLESTYVNAAIAFSDMYDRYGRKDFLNSAIENCNKSIKILPDYGLAFALKLELYIMAISKAFDGGEVKQFENELLKVFKDIENNTSIYLCAELIARIEADRKSFMGPYLEKLYKEYADEMAKIGTRATAVSQPVNPPVNTMNS